MSETLSENTPFPRTNASEDGGHTQSLPDHTGLVERLWARLSNSGRIVTVDGDMPKDIAEAASAIASLSTRVKELSEENERLRFVGNYNHDREKELSAFVHLELDQFGIARDDEAGNELSLMERLATLRSENERLTRDLDAARLWHEKAHTFLEERNTALASLQQMRKALKRIALQKTSEELSDEEYESADFEGAWDIAVTDARSALREIANDG